MLAIVVSKDCAHSISKSCPRTSIKRPEMTRFNSFGILHYFNSIDSFWSIGEHSTTQNQSSIRWNKKMIFELLFNGDSKKSKWQNSETKRRKRECPGNFTIQLKGMCLKTASKCSRVGPCAQCTSITLCLLFWLLFALFYDMIDSMRHTHRIR